MPFPWVIVGGTGYDVEDVLQPQTRDMACPACEKRVRFVEKQMVKNLRVFGVPLVGVERGRRVFECPHCRACVEAPSPGSADAAASSGEAGSEATSRRAMDTRIETARDTMWLWQRRGELADQHGDAELYAEARKMAADAQREVERLEAQRDARGPADLAAPRLEREKPVVVARPSGRTGEVGTAVEDEFAALKARIAKRARDEQGVATADEAPRSASSETGTVAADEATSRADGPDDVEEALGALKARMAGRSGGRDEQAFDELKRQLREPPVTAVNAPPVATPAEPATEDPAAALKRKLRPRP